MEARGYSLQSLPNWCPVAAPVVLAAAVAAGHAQTKDDGFDATPRGLWFGSHGCLAHDGLDSR